MSSPWTPPRPGDRIAGRRSRGLHRTTVGWAVAVACLPTPATLTDFDVDAAAGIDRKLIDELGTCRYLDSATNILLIGSPGLLPRANDFDHVLHCAER